MLIHISSRENEAKSNKSKVSILGANVTSPTPVRILKDSIASRQPMMFGVGPITGGTPDVTFLRSLKVSSSNSLPSDGS